MSAPDYKALIASGRTRRKPAQRFDPETAAARNLEKRARATEAVRRARMALSMLHPEDHKALYVAALDEINGERGPLPGDDQ